MNDVLASLALIFLPLIGQCAQTNNANASATQAAKVLDEIVVLGHRENLVGEAISASQGAISAEDLRRHPITRAGDLMEYVPGMIATQHSGSGKANQYFLRGFNLDHGTDFSTTVEDVPVNLRTHGHGHGYSDLNFLIPEMVGELRYVKGPYSAENGDFSSAGASRFTLASDLGTPKVSLSAGSYGYWRLLGLGSEPVAAGVLNYGIERQGYSGPWDQLDEGVKKTSLALKWVRALESGQLRATMMAYDNSWRAADQIPQRAVSAGLISEFGQLDTAVGGESSRYSFSAGLRNSLAGGEIDAAIYYADYDLDLYSNFTYLLDDPSNGDQFNQFDQRRLFGGAVKQMWQSERWQFELGLQTQVDLIEQVGLSKTKQRLLVRPVRDDRVREASVGLYTQAQYRFTDQLRGYIGLRADRYDFDVEGQNCAVIENSCANSGKRSAHNSSPKFSLIFTPTNYSEFYLSYGQGFHSNDARGATIRVDPFSGEPTTPVTPLVDSVGAELGARFFLSERFNSTISLWRLDVDSELLFVGDAGGTEATRPSTRRGIEVGGYYFPNDRVNFELEASYTRSRFDDPDPVGSHIPGAIPLTLSAGVNSKLGNGFEASLHLRHFGSYALIENNQVQSAGSSLVNAKLSKSWGSVLTSIELLNLLDSKDHDVDYYYASRLPGEPAEGVEDLHFHVFEPRSVRFSLALKF